MEGSIKNPETVFDSPPKQPPATNRLYLADSYCFEAEVSVAAVRDNSVTFNQTCFFPGGGGQPSDEGFAEIPSGEVLEIGSVQADANDILWHFCKLPPPPHIVGQPAKLFLNRGRRIALMRHHTSLHVLNTIALRNFGGWITGVQIGVDYSRIDFKIEGFSLALVADLEKKVNAVLAENHSVTASYRSEEEFRNRGDLIRTLQAKPPVSGGWIRVVEIQGFEAQACGGTHVKNTSEVGRLSIFRTENKGKINKRLYTRLEQSLPPSSSS